MRIRKKYLSAGTVFLAGFLLAFALRAYLLEDIHYKFDEWLGTLQPGPALSWSDGIFPIIRQIHTTAQYYVTSTMTITTCVLMQVLKLFTGPDLAPMRWWFIIAASLGVGMTVFIFARLYRPGTPATWSVVLMGSFSVCAIVFSQFANNFSFTYLMTALQVGVYLRLVRGRWKWPGFLLFSLVAYLCQLVMYTQLLITAGLYLAALIGIGFASRRLRHYFAWFFGGMTYLAVSFIHFFAAFSRIPWSEPFRGYMAPYYPLFLLSKGGVATGWDHSWAGYYLLRLYDLFDYQWSLVFNPGIYQPLKWNWVSLPFLLVLLLGAGCALINWRWARVSSKSKCPPTKIPKTAEVIMRCTDSSSRYIDGGIPLIFISVLIVHIIANRLLFITFGGTRQCVYLAPLFWLFYGWLMINILGIFRSKRNIRYYFTVISLLLLPIIPFAVSLPGLYRDRVSRLDLDLVAQAVDRYQPELILAPRDSIQGIQLTMIADPRFTDLHWPGYPYESDILDADPVLDHPGIAFTFNGREYLVNLVSQDNFPEDKNNFLYIDLYMSFNGRYEDGQLKQFYTPLENIVSKGRRIIPLSEKPGNALKAIHQSIYWPPNSFYMYRVIKE